MAGVVEGLAPTERRLPPPECLAETEMGGGCKRVRLDSLYRVKRIVHTVKAVGNQFFDVLFGFYRLCRWFFSLLVVFCFMFPPSSYQPTHMIPQWPSGSGSRRLVKGGGVLVLVFPQPPPPTNLRI